MEILIIEKIDFHVIYGVKQMRISSFFIDIVRSIAGGLNALSQIIYLYLRFHDLSKYGSYNREFGRTVMSILRGVLIEAKEAHRPKVGMTDDGDISCEWDIGREVLYLDFDMEDRTISISWSGLDIEARKSLENINYKMTSRSDVKRLSDMVVSILKSRRFPESGATGS